MKYAMVLTGHALVVRLEVLEGVGTGIAELRGRRDDAAVLLLVTPVHGGKADKENEPQVSVFSVFLP